MDVFLSDLEFSTLVKRLKLGQYTHFLVIPTEFVTITNKMLFGVQKIITEHSNFR